MKRALYSLIALLLSSIPAVSHAQQDWWFDVEVILFDRGQSLTSLKEQFEYTSDLGEANATWDLLSALFQPDISRLKQSLPVCGKPDSIFWEEKRSLPMITGYRPTFNLDEMATSFTQHVDKNTLEMSTTVDAFQAGDAQQSVSAVTPAKAAQLWLAFNGPAPLDIQIPDIQYCEPAHPWISWQNNQWRVYQPDNSLPFPDEMPIVPQGSDEFDGSPHILPGEARELTKLSQQIRQTRGLTRLLHTTWRQPVSFGQNNAASVRLFAGQDFSKKFTSQGLAKVDLDAIAPETNTQDPGAAVEQEDFFRALRKRLHSESAVSFNQMLAAAQSGEQQQRELSTDNLQTGSQGPLWQIDGYMKVYLKNVNRVPYLHIDSNLFYRQPVPVEGSAPSGERPEYELVAVPFHQMRRVISKQLHYFDHPLFGMVVKIRRFKMPEGF